MTSRFYRPGHQRPPRVVVAVQSANYIAQQVAAKAAHQEALAKLRAEGHEVIEHTDCDATVIMKGKS